jgi:hypothetical protein
MVLLACVSLQSCGPSWSVKPHPKGKTAIHLRTGLFTVPKEYDDGFSSMGFMTGGSVGVGYGLTEWLSPWVAAYPFLMFQGIPYGEVGLLTGIVTPEDHGFGISVNPHLHVSSRFVIPQADVDLYYESRSLRPYVGASYYKPLWLVEDSVGNYYAPTLNAGVVCKTDNAQMGIDLRFPIRRLFRLQGDPDVGQFGLGFTFVPGWSPFDDE